MSLNSSNVVIVQQVMKATVKSAEVSLQEHCRTAIRITFMIMDVESRILNCNIMTHTAALVDANR